MAITLEEAFKELDLDLLEMNQRIHPLLDEMVWKEDSKGIFELGVQVGSVLKLGEDGKLNWGKLEWGSV